MTKNDLLELDQQLLKELKSQQERDKIQALVKAFLIEPPRKAKVSDGNFEIKSPVSKWEDFPMPTSGDEWLENIQRDLGKQVSELVDKSENSRKFRVFFDLMNNNMHYVSKKIDAGDKRANIEVYEVSVRGILLTTLTVDTALETISIKCLKRVKEDYVDCLMPEDPEIFERRIQFLSQLPLNFANSPLVNWNASSTSADIYLSPEFIAYANQNHDLGITVGETVLIRLSKNGEITSVDDVKNGRIKGSEFNKALMSFKSEN
jgi:hypothetical protein